MGNSVMSTLTNHSPTKILVIIQYICMCPQHRFILNFFYRYGYIYDEFK